MSEQDIVPKLTPLDIQQQQFRSALRGYDRVEVLEFLELVRREYERTLHENVTLRERVKEADANIARLQEQEQELRRCISTAQGMADEVVSQAKREASVLQSEAESKAKARLSDAEMAHKRLRVEVADLRALRDRLRLSLRTMVEGQLQLLDAEAEAEAVVREVQEVEQVADPETSSVEVLRRLQKKLSKP